MLSERRDTVVGPFTGPLSHLFVQLDAWAAEQRESLWAEINTLVGLLYGYCGGRLLKKAVQQGRSE